MGEAEKKVTIESVKNSMDKRDTFNSHMKRYNKAIKAECYLEALMIDYACLEDRLRSILCYLGVLKDWKDNQLKGKVTKAAYNAIVDDYLVNTDITSKKKSANRRIKDISGKANYLKGVFLMLSDPKNAESEDIVRKILWNAFHGDSRIEETLSLIESINIWCDYRNKVVHELMNNNIDSLEEHLAEQAEAGFKLFRKLDNTEKWIKGKKIPEKISIAAHREKNRKNRRTQK